MTVNFDSHLSKKINSDKKYTKKYEKYTKKNPILPFIYFLYIKYIKLELGILRKIA